MKKCESHKERFAEVLRFGVAGLLSFVIDFSLLILSQEVLGFGFFQYGVLLSTAVAFLVSVIFHYWISSVWVFKESANIGKAKHVIRGFAFLATSGMGFLLTEVGMWAGVTVLCYSYILVKIFVTGCVMIWNYGAQKFVIFK